MANDVKKNGVAGSEAEKPEELAAEIAAAVTEAASMENVTAEAAAVVEETVESEEVRDETEEKGTSLKVERRGFMYNGKKCYNYFIEATLRGRKVTINLVPSEQTKDGFEVLDFVFGDAKTADLIVTKNKMYDEGIKRIRRFSSYEVRNIDRDGQIWKSKIKPEHDADKTKLEMLLAGLT